MKKVLIFTAGYGEGHNTAARNVRDALLSVDPACDVEVLDLFESTYGKFNDFVKKAYLMAINKAPKVWGKIYDLIDRTTAVQSNMIALRKMRNALAALLAARQPDAIVCTYPIYHYLIDELYRDGRPRPFAQVMIITDSLTINSVWVRCHSDFLLVANEASADVLRKIGIAENKIRVPGFPVTPRFATLKATRPPMDSVIKVLFMINSGKDTAPEVVRKLSQRSDIALTVTVGRDEALRRAIAAAASDAPHPVELHGWTDQIPELLLSHHLLISKAGGATVQESIASCTPMIITQVVPGQEEGNARLIVENECGALATTPDAIVESVGTALKNNGALYHRWQANITKLSRPQASLDIARFVLDLQPTSLH